MADSLIVKLSRKIKKIPGVGRWAGAAYMAFLGLLPKSTVVWMYRGEIDWSKVDQDIADFLSDDSTGLTENNRNPRVVVSLTSYPPRIPRIHYTIYTLLNQTFKPDKLVLWLAEEQFPNKNDDLPTELLAMQAHGLSIRYTRDTRAYKKLIPALTAFPDDIVVTVDDDVKYDRRMLEALYRSYKRNPRWIHANRAHRVALDSHGRCKKYTDWETAPGSPRGSYRTFFTGVGGVLYPPHTLHADITNDHIFLEMIPSNDDIWFWGMAVVNETKICAVENGFATPVPNHPLSYEDVFQGTGLITTNVFGGQNDVQLARIMEHYPVIRECLLASDDSMG